MSNSVTSAVVYEGPSRIDGAPIVVIVTGLSGGSSNAKTGDMVQSWILRADLSPLDALRQRADVSICGGCEHRPKSVGMKKVKGKLVATWFGRSCYVNVSQAPTSVWRAYSRGSYPRLTMNQLAAATAGRMVRLGSYGDPAAAPLEIWQAYTALAAGWTGYTHQWQSAKLRDVTRFCQASADTEQQATKAQRLGLGYFRVAPLGDEPLQGEVRCPASTEAGKVATCSTCRLCNGQGAAVMINAHGIGAKHVTTRRAALPVLA